MALSDSPIGQKDKRNMNRALEGPSKRWSDKQKLEAIHTYLALGNLSLTGRVLNIPEVTLRVWKATEWWKEVMDEVKSQERIELSNKLKRIVDAAHTVVENRLVNGDPVVIQKTGEIIMKPVAMKDAHRVAVDLLNQREVVEKSNKPTTQVVEGNDAKLQQLAEKFAEFATKKIEQKIDKNRTVDVQMVEVVDAEMVQDDSVPDEVLSGGRGADEEMGEEGEALVQGPRS